MRAAILTATRRIEIQEVPVPVPGPGEVLIRVRVAGVCGSELHAFNGTHPFRKPPAQQGHEMAGDITEVGPGVESLAVGDRVTVIPIQPCGRCSACLDGTPNLCDAKVMLGTKQWPGCYADYITAPVANVYRIPPHVSYHEGTIVEPLAVAVHVVRRAGSVLGHTVAVLGAGTIGLACVAVAREAGAASIVSTDVVDFNLAAARKFGATLAVNVRRENPVEAIRRATGGQGADVALVTAGISPVVNQALAAVRRRGEVVTVALFDGPITLDDPFQIVGSEKTLKGSQIYTGQDFQVALDLIASGRVSAGAFITHRLPLEAAQQGLELLDAKKEDCIKVLLEVG